MKKIFISTVLVLSSVSLFAQDTISYSKSYYLGFGLPYYNSTSLQKENFISANKAIIYGLRQSDRIFKETKANPLQIGFRLIRSLALDFPISFYAAEIPHEIGHGTPAANYGGSYSYSIGFPPLPYNFNYSSSASWSGFDEVPEEIQEEWSNHAYANGLQTEKYIGRSIKEKYWNSNYIDYDDATLLLKTDYAPMWYVLFLPASSGGTDIIRVLERYKVFDPNIILTEKKIQRKTFFINSLNPINILTWYTLGKYIVTGEASTKLPSIKIGNKLEYLPGLSYDFTGFGEEFLLDNYYRFGDKSGVLTIGYGTVLSKYRFAFSMNNVWKSSNQKHNFGFDLNIWEQRDFGISPKLNYHLSIKKILVFILHLAISLMVT